MLDAVLRPSTVAEPLIKDTLADTDAPQTREPTSAIPANVTKPSTPAAPTTPTTRKPAAKATRAAEQKLAEHVYYPPEAIAAGWEGEVRLMVTLSADGNVVDAQVAGSSGHESLDRAAVRAAFAMGALPGLDKTEIILPVVFRLQP